MPFSHDPERRFHFCPLVVFGLGTAQLATGGAALGQFDTYPLLSAPKELARADFNIDGHTDLVTVATDQIEVLLNAGNGTFLTSVAYPGGGSWLEVGDVDDDYDADVVTAGSGTIKVYMNRGDGTFDDPILIDAPGTFKGLALGDVDADRDLDIALITEEEWHYMRWFRNDGGTAFVQAGHTRIMGKNGTYAARELVAGDFDDDGDSDFACGADSGYYGKYSSAVTNVCILKNMDGGTTWDSQFVRMKSYHYDAGPLPTSLQVGDMNNDGSPDISCLFYDSESYNEPLKGKVLTNNGNGGFSATNIFKFGGQYTAYDCEQPIADFDGDGDLDLITSLTRSGGDRTQIYTVLRDYYNNNYYSRSLYDGPNLHVADMILTDTNADA